MRFLCTTSSAPPVVYVSPYPRSVLIKQRGVGHSISLQNRRLLMPSSRFTLQRVMVGVYAVYNQSHLPDPARSQPRSAVRLPPCLPSATFSPSPEQKEKCPPGLFHCRPPCKRPVVRVLCLWSVYAVDSRHKEVGRQIIVCSVCSLVRAVGKRCFRTKCSATSVP